MAITKLTSKEIDSVGGAGTKVGAAMTLGVKTRLVVDAFNE